MKWICDACEVRLVSMRKYSISAEEYFNLHDLVGKLIGQVKSNAADNLRLNSRIQNICLPNSRPRPANAPPLTSPQAKGNEEVPVSFFWQTILRCCNV